MNRRGFQQLYWGFLFIMVDFRIAGIDFLPDIVGYILFASGFGLLAASSDHFRTAAGLNTPMIVLSLFSLYQYPVEGGGYASPLGWLGVLIGIAATVLDLLVVYHLFIGVQDMARGRGSAEITAEAGVRWQQYLLLHLAILFGLVIAAIPVFGFFFIVGLFIAAIVLTVVIMRFMTRCGETLA